MLPLDAYLARPLPGIAGIRCDRKAAETRGMRFAYADPPYIGQARKHYSHDPRCAEVDHAELIGRLCAEYPDGWALSLSSPSLKQILALCPDDVRVMAWTKPFAAFKAGVNPAYAWEPVIVRGGRKRTRAQPTVRDWVSEVITLKKGMVGAKPRAFCFWLFSVLNIQPGDTLDDLFPGTGIVSACLAEFLNDLFHYVPEAAKTGFVACQHVAGSSLHAHEVAPLDATEHRAGESKCPYRKPISP